MTTWTEKTSRSAGDGPGRPRFRLSALRSLLSARLMLVALLLVSAGVPAWSQLIRIDRPSTASWKEHQRRGGELLKEQLRQARNELNTLDRRIPPLREEIQRLLQQLQELQTTASDPAEKATDSGAKKVKFRPPLAHRVNRNKSLLFVCQGNRIIPLAPERVLKTAGQHREKIVEAANAVQQGAERKEVRWTVPSGVFDVRQVLLNRDGRVAGRVEVICNPGEWGEAPEDLSGNGADFLRLLTEADPKTHLIQFAVYPDSYEAFRQARSLVWEREFDVFWMPMDSGEPMRLGEGGESIGI